jgi:hypothetical protein
MIKVDGTDIFRFRHPVPVPVLLKIQSPNPDLSRVNFFILAPSVADLDPGSGAFLTPGSEMGFFGSPTHFSESLVAFLVIKYYKKFFVNWLNIFFLCLFCSNFVKFVATKKVSKTTNFPPLFCCCWIRDQRSGMEKNNTDNSLYIGRLSLSWVCYFYITFV